MVGWIPSCGQSSDAPGRPRDLRVWWSQELHGRPVPWNLYEPVVKAIWACHIFGALLANTDHDVLGSILGFPVCRNSH